MKKRLQRILSILCVLALAIGCVSLAAFAEGPEINGAFADGENSLIVFVTGIGQSFSYLIDDSYREEPLWWNFFIEGALQQEGVEPVIMLSHEPISFDAGVDGWNEGNQYDLPL